MKKVATAICLVLVMFAMCACLVACENIQGEVTAEQWQQRVNINLEQTKTFTMTIVEEPLYPKNQANEYGWNKVEKTIKIDLTNGRAEAECFSERWQQSLFDRPCK